MKISEELREMADRFYPESTTKERLIAFADRIDAEMVELPRDKDGKPIRVGETVYGKDGRTWHVRGVTIGEMSEASRCVIFVTSDSNDCRHFKPEWLTHKRPDSWERIAYDVETCVFIDDEDENRFRRELADRIRRLAKKEER